MSGGSTGRIPAEFLDRIKTAVSIVEVIGEHVVLRKSGSNHRGLCPFHSERTPSFDVSENKQLYHCKGCQRGGDLFRFVMELHGIGFREAVEELADRARIPLPTGWNRTDEEGGDPEAQKRRDEAREKLATAHKLNRFAASFFHQQLAQSPEAMHYLEKRGCTAELLRNFYVGVAPPGWDALATKLTTSKAPLPLAVELGLVKPSQKSGPQGGSGYYDVFRNRIMFPIIDLRGKVTGFGGRALGGGSDEQGPKYFNSYDSFLFQKSKLAFGLFQAQKHIREKKEIILVEGYFDVVALHAAGFANAVATCGTAMTPEHLQLFRKFANRIILLFDGDKAGISATERAMQLGLDHGMILHGAVMPAGLDPDEVLFDQETGKPTPDGVARMQAILSAAAPVLDTRIDQCIRDAAEGPEQRVQSIKQIGRWLASYQDPVGREVRVQDVQKRLGISRNLLEQAAQSGNSLRPARPAGGQAISSAADGANRPVLGVLSGSNAALPPAPGASPIPKPNPSGPVSPVLPGAGASATAARKGPKKPSRTEVLLLTGIARGGEYGRLFTEAGSKLPPSCGLPDLFEYLPAKGFLMQLQKDTGLEGDFSKAVSTLLQQAQDPQLRSVLTEALVRPSADEESKAGAGGEDTGPHDFRTALGRAVGRAWARFSQQIKARIAEAEASKDAELQEKLMQEYLDVQRKMKEFSSFYEEA